MNALADAWRLQGDAEHAARSARVRIGDLIECVHRAGVHAHQVARAYLRARAQPASPLDYHEPINWLDDHRFYLDQSQCDRVNAQLQRWQIDEAKVWNFDSQIDGDDAVVSFNAVCDWRSGEHVENNLLSFWTLQCIHRPAGWKLHRIAKAKVGPGGRFGLVKKGQEMHNGTGPFPCVTTDS